MFTRGERVLWQWVTLAHGALGAGSSWPPGLPFIEQGASGATANQEHEHVGILPTGAHPDRPLHCPSPDLALRDLGGEASLFQAPPSLPWSHFFKDKNNFNKDMIRDTKYINIIISNINNKNTTLEQSLFKKLKPIFNYRKI